MNVPAKAAPKTRSLSVVLPVRNRASTIGQSLDTICRACEERPASDWELIVVDDASEDATTERIFEFSHDHPQVLLLQNPSVLGPGYASRHGILLSQGERILLAATGPPEPWPGLGQMEDLLGDQFDLAVAAERAGEERPLPPIRIWRELLRRIGSPAGGADRGKRRPEGLPFHLYRREAALEIYGRQRLDGPSFALEALYLARRYEYRVLEVGIAPLISSVPASDGSAVGVGDLLRIRCNRLRGHYG